MKLIMTMLCLGILTQMSAADVLKRLKFTEKGMSVTKKDGFTQFKGDIDTAFCFAKLPKTYKGKITLKGIFQPAKDKPYTNMTMFLGNLKGPMVGAGGFGTGTKEWWISENEKVSYHGKSDMSRETGPPTGGGIEVPFEIILDLNKKEITFKMKDKEISRQFNVDLKTVNMIAFSSWKKDGKIKGQFKDIKITTKRK